MRGSVFAQADRIVREHEQRTQLHQRRHSQRVAGIIGKREERADVGNEAPMQRESVGDGAHREFADAVVDVVAGGVGHDGHASGPVGEDRSRQVGGAADQFRQTRCEGLDGLLRSLARRDRLTLRGLRGYERIGGRSKSGGE